MSASFHLARQTAVERPVMEIRQVRGHNGSCCNGGASRRDSDVSGDVMIGAVLCRDDVTSPSRLHLSNC